MLEQQQHPFLPAEESSATTTTSLLGGLRLAQHEFTDTAGIPTRPQRLWKVQDTQLPPFPAFFLPPPVVAVTITTASPSVIAVRIAEALTRRSVAAEYDDEAATADCWTVDRVHFVVHLWSHKNNTTTTTGGVLVECRRVSGSTLSFHPTARAILRAAQSLDSGADRRSEYQCGVTEYPRLIEAPRPVNTNNNTIRPAKLLRTARHVSSAEAREMATEALEQAYQLLCKDRHDARLIGMESLVHATDVACVGEAVAQHAALVVLGASSSSSSSTATGENANDSNVHRSLVLQQIHEDWILGLLTENQDKAGGHHVTTTTPSARSSLQPTALDEPYNNNNADEEQPQDFVIFQSHMRALALRAFVNALSVLSKYQPATLNTLLSTQSSANISPLVVEALVRDWKAATRPATCGRTGSSQHEATLAVRAVRLLLQHSSSRSASQQMLLLESLEKLSAVGRSTHAVLAAEARLAYQCLSEHDRSC